MPAFAAHVLMTVPEPSRQGMPPQAQGASAEGVAGEGSVERRFNRCVLM